MTAHRITSQFQCQISREGLLSGLPLADAATLEAAKTLEVYAAGNILFYQNHHPQGIFYILSGHIKLYQIDAKGRPRNLRIAAPGELVGHEALRKGQVYSTNAQAMEICRVCIVPGVILSAILEKNPSILVKMIQKLEADLKRSRQAVEDVHRKPVRARLASLLLDFRTLFGRTVGGRVEMDLLLTRAELADLACTTTETVIRVLNQLKQDRLIDLPRARTVVIRNEQGLKDAASPDENDNDDVLP